MTRPERVHGSARDWLVRARSALALARASAAPEVVLEDLCYQAQQAAEKALKAVLVHRAQAFRFTHDLEDLATSLEGHDVELPEVLREAIILTRYAVDARYPGPYEPVTHDDHQEALSLAEAVVRWAEGIVAPDLADR